MKKYLGISAMALSALIISTVGVTAFANEPVLISAKDTTTAVDTTKVATAAYSALTGKITACEKNEQGYSITFESNEMGTIILNEAENGCLVFDGSKLADFTALKADTEVTVVLDNNAPMTMSLPGQTNGAVAIVMNNNAFVGKFNDALENDKLKLEIGDNTQILDVRGTKQILKADDIKGKEAIVVYGVSTKSIPAITTPDFVVILDNDADVEVPEETKPEETKPVEKVTLRKAFEEKGYKVEWTANDKPIVISNDKVKAEVTIGSNKVVVDGDMAYEISAPVELIDGVTYVTSDALELF